MIVGLCGAQGSGKSTLAEALDARLKTEGLTSAIVSLDDLYLTREDREALAREVHPLLRTRGVPGTHDVALGIELFDALGRSGAIGLPRFDKSVDTRALVADWPVVEAPIDILIFEGWCVGAIPQGSDALAEPINALERGQDSGGVWRNYANNALADPYQALFGRIDMLVMLAAPGFDIVRQWRTQQEHGLRNAKGRSGGAGIMSDAEVGTFVQYYERLTRHILAEMPARADLTLFLDEERRVQHVARRDRSY